MQEYMDLADVADYWGVDHGTVRRYHYEGRLPDADAVIGLDTQRRRKYGWLPETITNTKRPGQGARTDLHKDSPADRSHHT